MTIAGLVLGLCLAGACSSTTRASGRPLDYVHRWWILLGRTPAQSEWRRATETAELVILNRDPHAPRLPQASAIQIAYLSVGEVQAASPYWSEIRGRSFAIEPNPAWPDNVRVDIRDRRWQSILLDREVPRLLAQGHQGLMLDTLDTAPYLERRDPVRFAGSRKALDQFLRLLRAQFPTAILLANGTETLVDAAPYVDGYVTEGIFATYDANPDGYRQSTVDERQWRLAQVAAALARVRRPVFSIEYASDLGAPGGLAEWAARQSQEHGFRPYVTTKSLDRLPPPLMATWPVARPAR